MTNIHADIHEKQLPFRDTQTVQQRHQVQQTTNAMSTQMTKIGVYVSNMEDILVAPGKYTTAAEHQEKRLENVRLFSIFLRTTT